MTFKSLVKMKAFIIVGLLTVNVQASVGVEEFYQARAEQVLSRVPQHLQSLSGTDLLIALQSDLDAQIMRLDVEISQRQQRYAKSNEVEAESLRGMGPIEGRAGMELGIQLNRMRRSNEIAKLTVTRNEMKLDSGAIRFQLSKLTRQL